MKILFVARSESMSASSRQVADRVQRVIDRELDVAVRKVEEPGADRAALADVIFKLTGEIRQQLALQLQVTRILIDLRELRDFQRTVVEVIAEEAPEVGRRLVVRLKERRALRSGAHLPTLYGGGSHGFVA
jgi:hypothetical protein